MIDGFIKFVNEEVGSYTYVDLKSSKADKIQFVKQIIRAQEQGAKK